MLQSFQYQDYYQVKKISVVIVADRLTHLDIGLKPVSIELQTVEKVGRKMAEDNATDIGLTRIAVRDLEYLPKGVETDLFRSLQYLPGVNRVGDISANYYVRGGGTNQNLILLNKAPIYYPFHAFGVLSAIDPEIINSLEFYKGGFTSEYHGRLSSVLNLDTKDGNKYKYSGKASISLLSGKALVEGPIPNGSFILSGRLSHSNQIMKKFIKKSAPVDFYDYYFKANYMDDTFMEGAKWTFYAFQSNDKLANNDLSMADFLWKNRIVGINLFQMSDNPLFYEVSFWHSRFHGEVFPNMSDLTYKRNVLNDYSVQFDFNYMYESKDELAAGLKIMEVTSTLLIENTKGLISDLGSFGTNFSAYFKYKFMRWENFGADVGTRINLTRLAKGTSSKYFVEPRVALTYSFSPMIQIKAAWGMYHQELTTLTDENEVITLFEPWLITPSYINPANAIHYVAGIYFNFDTDFTLEFEGYYKDISDLPTLNDQKFFDDDPDLVSATGESYGAEALLRYTEDPINIIGSYSLGWAYKEIDGWLYYPKYDTRNTGSISLEYNLGSGWRASASWSYSSGAPFTQIEGYYDKIQTSGRTNPYDLFGRYAPYTILADKNLGRLPDYHRLDLNLSKSFVWAGTKVKVDLSVLNVYDRANIFYFDRNTGDRVNMLPFLPSITIAMEI
ncbi:TonB-dependent receptor plug domain-containing protein [Bacteroidota bacterium]